MHAQLDLLTAPPPAQRHSGTSVTAAQDIEPKAGTLRRMVLDHLRWQGGHGATDEEIQIHLDMDANTERPRRIELVRAGKAYDCGVRRKTNSGKQAVVWRAT